MKMKQILNLILEHNQCAKKRQRTHYRSDDEALPRQIGHPFRQGRQSCVDARDIIARFCSLRFEIAKVALNMPYVRLYLREARFQLFSSAIAVTPAQTLDGFQ